MSASPLQVLHLEDDASDAELAAHVLRSAGIATAVTVVDTETGFVEALAWQHVDVVIADYSLPAFNGLAALALVRATRPLLPFILLSGSLGEEVAVEALKSGATDYVLKSRLSRLVPAVRRAMKEVEDRGARQRAEHALRESETLLQTLVESLAEGVLACALSGRFLHWNQAALKLHGLTSMSGRESLEQFQTQFEVYSLDGHLVPFEDWPLSRVLRDGELHAHEARVRHIDTTWERILSYAGSIIRDADGRPIMAILTMTDITERKAAEQLLLQTEANFHRMIDGHTDGLVVTDVHGMVLFVNPATVAIWQGPDQPRPGAPLGLPIVTGEDRELILYGPDDAQIVVETRSVSIEWQGAAAFLVSLRDISAHKRSEEALKQANDEVQRVNRSLVDRNTEIQNFYHTLSHELKTPLTSAREFLSIVSDGLAGPLTTSQEEFLGIAIESCDQMRLYVNDLLDVTRIETGKLSLECQPARLDALVARVVEMLSPAAAGKDLTLSHDAEADLPAIPVDQQRILQVLTNLTANAIKFTDPGGWIHLTVGEAPNDPTSLQVSVRDTGRGIPADELDLIFTRLYQANRDHLSAESRSGLGLGLYICREMVQMHGGRIWVESRLDHGSVFSFTLPKSRLVSSVSADTAAEVESI